MGKIHSAFEKSKKEAGTGQLLFSNSAADKIDHMPLDEASSAAVLEQPMVNTAIDPYLVAYRDPLSHAAEQFRILRTHLLFPTKGRKPPRIVMVTSARQGEGKSLTTANLAVTMAQSINDHVLLIDCDMRRPAQHEFFGFGQVDGLSSYLSGTRKLEEILLKTPVNKLTLIPGGAIPPNPYELLSSNKMVELLEEVTNRYHDRFIILDTPPPQLTAETNMLASCVDSILIVMKYLKTPRAEMEELIEKLDRSKILGILLNEFDRPLMKYGGHHQYYYKSLSTQSN